MKIQQSGGPAFPVIELDNYGNPVANHIGLAIRDYFAAKAMQAYALEIQDDEKVARLAYKTADAMIAERSKP